MEEGEQQPVLASEPLDITAEEEGMITIPDTKDAWEKFISQLEGEYQLSYKARSPTHTTEDLETIRMLGLMGLKNGWKEETKKTFRQGVIYFKRNCQAAKREKNLEMARDRRLI